MRKADVEAPALRFSDTRKLSYIVSLAVTDIELTPVIGPVIAVTVLSVKIGCTGSGESADDHTGLSADPGTSTGTKERAAGDLRRPTII